LSSRPGGPARRGPVDARLQRRRPAAVSRPHLPPGPVTSRRRPFSPRGSFPVCPHACSRALRVHPTLKDVFGRRGAELEEKLFFATGDTQRQANLLDQFFLSRLAVLPEYARVMSWLKAIEAQRGMVSILELSRLSGLSVRSVDRLFQQVIGLPPKFVARTVRFRHALHHLMAQPATRW